MTEEAKPVTEKTLIQLSISSWFHVMVIVAAMFGIYFALRADVSKAIEQSSQNNVMIQQFQNDLMTIRINAAHTEEELKSFHSSYERDSNRYIREPRDRTDR